jgi:hypothetical protein
MCGQGAIYLLLESFETQHANNHSIVDDECRRACDSTLLRFPRHPPFDLPKAAVETDQPRVTVSLGISFGL